MYHGHFFFIYSHHILVLIVAFYNYAGPFLSTWVIANLVLHKHHAPSIRMMDLKQKVAIIKLVPLLFISLFPFNGRVVQTGGQEYKYIK